MDGITILDGGMGQELVHRSGQVPSGLWSAEIMIKQPDLVRAVHDDFFKAGAQIATANSYTLHRDRLKPFGREDEFEALHKMACELACRSRDQHGSGLVAGSLGPLGWSYSHDGAPPEEQWAGRYNEICRIQADYVDLFLIETISSRAHALAALSGAMGNGKPVWIALTVDDTDGTRLRSGEDLQTVCHDIARHGPQAILLNCSVPEAITQGLPLLQDVPCSTGAYANGFTGINASFLKKSSRVSDLSARTNFTPDVYSAHAARWIGAGATIVGGCCEVGPAHIADLNRRFGAKPGAAYPQAGQVYGGGLTSTLPGDASAAPDITPS